MTLKFGPARTDSVIIAGNGIAICLFLKLICAEEVVSALNR